MNWILPTIIFLLFCVSHSYLAEASVKQKIFTLFSSIQPFYRMLYSIASVFLLMAWILLLPEENELIYTTSGILKWIIISLNVSAVIFLIYVILTFNLGVFIGTRQIKNFIQYKNKPEYLDEPEKGKLITSGVHKYVRHPLYTFSVLVLITNPAPTITEAYLSGCVMLYFWIGSYFEEKKLIQRFGEDYVEYQKGTGKFFPRIVKRAR